MSFDDLKQGIADSGDGTFVKLKSGEEITGVFRGEPYVFYKKFPDKEHYQTKVPGSSMRFQINFIVKTKEGYEAKILEQGVKVGDALQEVKEEYGLDSLFKIKRVGSTKDDTTYHLLFKGDLTTEQKKAIAAVDLIELKPYKAKESKKETVNREPGDEQLDEDLPF